MHFKWKSFGNTVRAQLMAVYKYLRVSYYQQPNAKNIQRVYIGEKKE